MLAFDEGRRIHDRPAHEVEILKAAAPELALGLDALGQIFGRAAVIEWHASPAFVVMPAVIYREIDHDARDNATLVQAEAQAGLPLDLGDRLIDIEEQRVDRAVPEVVRIRAVLGPLDLQDCDRAHGSLRVGGGMMSSEVSLLHWTASDQPGLNLVLLPRRLAHRAA